jgi:pimeloyl-ACP methyl ester carboxylesterase
MTHSFLSRRSLIATAALTVPAFALPWQALAKEATGPFKFVARSGQEVEAERGFFEVPEDRRISGSRRIRLGYVRFASTAKNPGAPIVYLAGGPGGSGVDAAMGARFPLFMALREVADVIALDQRGTGLSASIPARAATTPYPEMTSAAVTAWFREEMQKAWLDWSRAGIAMTGYNTEQSADDIEDLRQHLGAEKLNLWGISYGTHLALSVLKRHPQSIEHVALASLEGQDQTVKRPAHIDRYFDRVDRLLDADPSTRAVIPSLPALMRRVHERLDAEPATVTQRTEGGPVEIKLGALPIQLMASSMVANPQQLPMLTQLYLALDMGQAQRLAAMLPPPDRFFHIAGMPEAMDLSSGISATRLSSVIAEAKTAILGDVFNLPMPQLLGSIPGADLGDAFRAPISISQPALLVAGTLDGRTPLEEQAEVMAQFQNKTQVLVENAGHNVFESHPEIQSLLVRFFGAGNVECTTLALEPPSFALS